LVDSRTNNYNFTIQVTGTNTGTWGDDVNNNVFTPLDAILGGTQSVVMTNADVTLSLSQWQNKAFKITGTLVASINLILPLSPNSIGSATAVGGQFVVDNRTAGNFSITVKTAAAGSTGVTVPSGARAMLYSDTVNVWYANDAFGIPAGTGAEWYGTTAPPGWFLCAAQSLLRAQYPALFNAIGTTYGAADGTHFTLPDVRGRVVAGKDDMGGSAANRITTLVTDIGTIVGVNLGSTGGSQSHVQTSAELATHTHVAHVVDPQHSHTTQGNISGNFGGTAQGGTAGTGTTGSSPTGISVNNDNAGSSNAMAWLQPTIIANKIIFAGA
jgi:microcystin-dependent protein